jgi:hypothetical protein
VPTRCRSYGPLNTKLVGSAESDDGTKDATEQESINSRDEPMEL